MLTLEQLATQFLWPLWSGLDAAYKTKYARNIWEQFEANVKSAAMTSETLSRFYSRICSRLPIEVRSTTHDPSSMEDVRNVLIGGGDRAVLRLLRTETTSLVLMVRLRNEERKALAQERIAARAAEELSESEMAAVERQKQKNAGLFEEEITR